MQHILASMRQKQYSSSVVRALASDDVVRVATVGDIVALHFTCKGEDGGLLESSYEANEPLSFEVCTTNRGGRLADFHPSLIVLPLNPILSFRLELET